MVVVVVVVVLMGSVRPKSEPASHMLGLTGHEVK